MIKTAVIPNIKPSLDIYAPHRSLLSATVYDALTGYGWKANWHLPDNQQSRRTAYPGHQHGKEKGIYHKIERR
jgi:hypothetical protein